MCLFEASSLAEHRGKWKKTRTNRISSVYLFYQPIAHGAQKLEYKQAWLYKRKFKKYLCSRIHHQRIHSGTDRQKFRLALYKTRSYDSPGLRDSHEQVYIRVRLHGNPWRTHIWTIPECFDKLHCLRMCKRPQRIHRYQDILAHLPCSLVDKYNCVIRMSWRKKTWYHSYLPRVHIRWCPDNHFHFLRNLIYKYTQKNQSCLSKLLGDDNLQFFDDILRRFLYSLNCFQLNWNSRLLSTRQHLYNWIHFR